MIAAVVVIAAPFAALTIIRSRHPGFHSTDSALCRHAYQRARSAVDTAVVDARFARSGQPKDLNALTCGALRRLGEL